LLKLKLNKCYLSLELTIIFYGDKGVDHLYSAINCDCVICVICAICDKDSGLQGDIRGPRGLLDLLSKPIDKHFMTSGLRGLFHLKVHVYKHVYLQNSYEFCFGHIISCIIEKTSSVRNKTISVLFLEETLRPIRVPTIIK
jgi:hypothetical protein